MRKLVSLADRLASHLDTNGPIPEHAPELGQCWLFTGHCDPKGYGLIAVRGADGKSRDRPAHRVALELALGGSLPADKPFALHRCDNHPCCRPAHLFAGTNADNVADKVAKRRHRFGETNHAKLTASDVHEARRLFVEGMGEREMATRFGVSGRTVYAAVHGITWKHLDDADVAREQRGHRWFIALSFEKAKEIRRAHAAGERTSDIARRYGVAACSVSNVIAGRAWREP